MVIKFGMEIWCGSDEPNRCVYRYNGEILGWEEDDDSDEPNVKLGEIDVYYCDRIRALDEGQGFWAAMDDAGHDTMECYEALIDQKTGDWKRAVREFIGEDALIMDNILLINRLELEERFRGKGLARKVVDEVIRTFRSQCAVIACKPFPLQYSGYMSSENESEGKSPDDEKRRPVLSRKLPRFGGQQDFGSYLQANSICLPDLKCSFHRFRLKSRSCDRPVREGHLARYQAFELVFFLAD